MKRLIAAVAILLGALSLNSSAQTYPAKPVKILVGFAPGGAADILWRILAERLTERLKQQVIIENRPAAGGIIAGQAVAKASPDGYTLLQVGSSIFGIGPALFKSLPYDPVSDFQMVSQVAYFGYAVVTQSSSKYHSVRDVIAEAKSSPGKINIGTIVVGSGQYLAAELLKSVAGIDAAIIPFKSSGELITALKSNDVHIAIETLPPVMPHIKNGAFRAIAVTSGQRAPLLPDAATMMESGVPGYDLVIWNGLAAPLKTPQSIVNLLNRELNAIVGLPEVQKKLLDLGFVAKGGTPEEFRALLIKDIAKWKDIIERAKIEKQ
jgi:tripartite-type tricarboxylate transporter receptor subunit TctC